MSRGSAIDGSWGDSLDVSEAYIGTRSGCGGGRPPAGAGKGAFSR
jgi:hypothetical protein